MLFLIVKQGVPKAISTVEVLSKFLSLSEGLKPSQKRHFWAHSAHLHDKRGIRDNLFEDSVSSYCGNSQDLNALSLCHVKRKHQSLRIIGTRVGVNDDFLGFLECT